MHTEWSILGGGGGLEQRHLLAHPKPQDPKADGSTSAPHGQYNPPAQDFVVTRGLPCTQGGQWLCHNVVHLVVWVVPMVGQKPEDKPAHNKPISTNNWTPPDKQTLANLLEALTIERASREECVQMYREWPLAVGNTVRTGVESTEGADR